MNIRSLEWLNKIKLEARSHEYVFHITLKYDDLHVPYLIKSNGGLVDINTGIFVDWSPENKFERDYYEYRKVFPYLDKKDFQLFIKRLRKECLNYESDSVKQKIRYVLASEYGPRTFRSHAHMLLFCDSKKIAKNIYKIVSKTWQQGSYSLRQCQNNDKALGYVSKYVVKPTNLPSLYSKCQIRPFFLFSKCPSIGSYKFEPQEVRKIFDEASPTFTIDRDSALPPLVVPLFRYIEDTLFPKISGFDRKSHYERVTLYGLFDYFGNSTKSQFVKRCVDECKKESFLSSCLLTFVKHSSKPKTFYQATHGSNFTPFEYLYAVSKRVCRNSYIFRCSVPFYVSQIEKYYSNKDYERLKKQIEYEKRYVEVLRGSPSDILLLDRLFVDDYNNCMEKCIFDSRVLSVTCQFSCPVPVHLSVSDSLDYKSLVADSENQFINDMKGKYLNDTFDLKRFKTTINHFDYVKFNSRFAQP